MLFPAKISVAPAGSLDVRMCYHAADQRVIAISRRHGSATFETWEWDGARWHQRKPAQSPPARQGYGFVYDSRRRVAVLFGGLTGSGGDRNDTWEWDSTNWTSRRSTATPPPRNSMAMAFDTRRQRVVVYGGVQGGATLEDLWEWDGGRWTMKARGAVNPGARAGGMMTYDSRRGVVVMFGGVRGFTFLTDVWEYDGSRWTQLLPTVRPPGLRAAALTYDSRAQRSVLYGGYDRGKPNTEVWEWDGRQWQRFATAVHPDLRLNAGFAYDVQRNRIVLHGGNYNPTTWLWNSATRTWTRGAHDGPKPVSSSLTANNGLGKTLFLAGFDTFEWDHAAAAWSRRPSAQNPSPLLFGALAFDRLRRQGVLLGAIAGRPAETWIWAERTRDWQQRSPAASPPPTQFGNLAFDVTRGRTVLFGGFVNRSNYSAQTWEWDGTTWLQRSPRTSPPPRTAAAMHHDSLTNRIVLFGGLGPGGRLDDVWDWDGTNWTRRAMRNAGPGPRKNMGVGSRADGLLIVGGDTDQGWPTNELWALRRDTWVRLPSGDLPPLTPALAAFDPLQRELMVFGGHTLGSNGRQLLFTTGAWRYAPPRALGTPIGRGCVGSNGIPELVAQGLPRIGNAGFGLTARNVVGRRPVIFLFGQSIGLTELPNRCRVFVSRPFANLAVTATANGTAFVPLRVPRVASLTGIEFSVQAAGLDPLRSGLAVTQALRLRIGR